MNFDGPQHSDHSRSLTHLLLLHSATQEGRPSFPLFHALVPCTGPLSGGLLCLGSSVPHLPHLVQCHLLSAKGRHFGSIFGISDTKSPAALGPLLSSSLPPALQPCKVKAPSLCRSPSFSHISLMTLSAYSIWCLFPDPVGEVGRLLSLLYLTTGR